MYFVPRDPMHPSASWRARSYVNPLEITSPALVERPGNRSLDSAVNPARKKARRERAVTPTSYSESPLPAHETPAQCRVTPLALQEPSSSWCRASHRNAWSTLLRLTDGIPHLRTPSCPWPRKAATDRRGASRTQRVTRVTIRSGLLHSPKNVRVAVVDLERQRVDRRRVDASPLEPPPVVLGRPRPVGAAVLGHLLVGDEGFDHRVVPLLPLAAVGAVELVQGERRVVPVVVVDL